MIEFINVPKVDEWYNRKNTSLWKHLDLKKDRIDMRNFLKTAYKLAPEFNFRLKWLSTNSLDFNNLDREKGYLYFKEGPMPFHWFILTPDLYCSRGVYWHEDQEKSWEKLHTPILWDKWPIKDNIIEFFRNTKWDQKYPGSTEDVPDLNFDYVFWPGQGAHRLGNPEDKKAYRIDMFEWAIDNKIHLVYKFHLAEMAARFEDRKRIKYIIDNYSKSPYIHLLRRGNLDKLVKNSIAVLSDHSHVAFQAMLHNKPVAHRRKINTMGYVIPTGDTPEKMWENKKVINQETVMKYFSFYYDFLIDVKSPNFKDKLRTRFQRYQDKAPIEEFFLP